MAVSVAMSGTVSLSPGAVSVAMVVAVSRAVSAAMSVAVSATVSAAMSADRGLAASTACLLLSGFKYSTRIRSGEKSFLEPSRIYFYRGRCHKGVTVLWEGWM